MRLSDARVVLTGASGGIGLAIAGALCASGAKVLAVARRRDPLEPLLARYPGQLCWVAADLTFLADRRKVLTAAQAMGGINLLINAAGVNHFAMLEQLDDSDINAMLAVNIGAPVCLTKTLLPLLKQAESAMVVNVGSTYGSIGYPGYAVYCATKFALRGFSEALRRELADTRVGVLYVAPRATHTSMNSPAAQALNDALKSNVDDPQTVASAVIHAIAGDRRDLYLGWPERFFMRLNSLLPNLVDRGLRKQLPLIRRLSQKPDNEHLKP
ncbi:MULTISPECIES: SDR family oxidoreductase [Pseudomonas]|uniref:SDR family oxidoreductase n=3 Tax=Pseudomonas chlororaphis TaxID=587753 RepID=A0AAQ0ASI3_9PSED|nr:MULTISPECIES: SDR family oxidoreductase [Pseudomonas]AIC20137.1 short-chain dehydrogenase [Pseudomonas chlororaphis]AUG41157.1 short chain dehydrogenase [Pseudomonas chlororaphis]AZD86094.1 Oxidoreductase, short-chain dehydrogenase/reductase family [Pseudomonas chlororaphis subsp. aureofaciens]AZD92591.1 Oxidoreductase, short-chain dehydrogenase/reductase family [Pseudomonas chlororaphis subsp. aureofaciens]AZE05240.1 Oxidoreductase, short-chain dehydrogenase/reductase family [Pseudomonas c